MKSIITKIRSLIRRARVSLSLPDTGTYPITQVEFLGKTSNMVVIWPYGMSGQLPVDAEAICFNIEGMEENKAGIGTVPTSRLKVNAAGEVVFGNPLTGSAVYYRANGDIEEIGTNDKSTTLTGNQVETIGGNLTEAITGNKEETITGNKDETITGDSTETITGDKDVTADNITATAATTAIISPTVNLGDLAGKTLMTSDIIALFNSHIHWIPAVGANTDAPTSGYSTANATSKTKAS